MVSQSRTLAGTVCAVVPPLEAAAGMTTFRVWRDVQEGQLVIDSCFIWFLQWYIYIEEWFSTKTIYTTICLQHLLISTQYIKARRHRPFPSTLTLTTCMCTNQCAVLHVLSEQPVVIQCVLGFSCHSVHRSLVHLVLYGSEQHVERLPCWLLTKHKEFINIRVVSCPCGPTVHSALLIRYI